jgi:hypothetical protein
VPLRVAREAADQAGLIQVVVDPEVSSSAQRRTTASLQAFGGEQVRYE